MSGCCLLRAVSHPDVGYPCIFRSRQDVEPDNLCPVERLFDILPADCLILRGIFADQMVQGPPTFLRCEPRAGPAVEQDAFVEGRKPRGQHLRFADDAESDAVALPEAVQLASFGGAVDVDRVGFVPDIVQGHSVAAAFGTLHAEYAVFAPPQQLRRLRLVEQAVLPAD